MRAQRRVPRIGFLGARVRSDAYYDAFVRGLRELGYVEGKTIVIDWRFANGDFERLPALAAELVALKPDLIVTHATPPSQVLKRATSTIPLVVMSVTDPVGAGLVASLARSGNNVTGLSNITIDVTPKQVELVKNVVPAVSRVGVFLNPANSAQGGVLRNIEAAARDVAIKILPVETRNAAEIERAFPLLVRDNAQAAIVAADSLFVAQGKQLAELALKHRVPLIVPSREQAEAGALMSYGPAIADIYRRGATYVDRILKGAKPGDLPIEQPTTVELVINLRTAKTLGLAIPHGVRVRAAAVIE